MNNTKNKYDQMLAVMNLAKAQGVIDSLSNCGRWTSDTLTVNEFVALKMAIGDALKFLNEDLLSRVEN